MLNFELLSKRARNSDLWGRCLGASQDMLESMTSKCRIKEGGNKKRMREIFTSILIRNGGTFQTFSELLQLPKVTRSRCLGVSLFPCRGRSACVLLRLLLQVVGRFSAQRKIYEVGCSKALTDKERAGMLTGRETPSGTWVSVTLLSRPIHT